MIDPKTVRVHEASFDFAARVPDWKPGARIKIRSNLGNGTGPHDGDGRSAGCESWCDSQSSEVHCSWCKCAGCGWCSGRSGLQIGQACTVPGQITSCWGAKIQEHELAGQAIARLGALTTDKEFGCNVLLPQGTSYKAPTLTCLDQLAAPATPNRHALPSRADGCVDIRPSAHGFPSEDVWYDPRGPIYDCWWYEHGGMLQAGGCLGAGANFGHNAEQACCACGGGSTKDEGCSMGAVFRRRPPGAGGDVGEVSLQYWRPGGTVTLEFTGTPVSLEVGDTWGATVDPDRSQPAWSNSVRFRLGDKPSTGVDGSSAFSFTATEIPETDELRITCVDPKSPLPPPPPLQPPWPPAPPPEACVLGASATLHELDPEPLRKMYLLVVALDSWADNAEVLLNFGNRSNLPTVLASWGATVATGTGAEPSAPFPNGRSPQWLATAASQSVRLRLSYGPRDFFGLELSGRRDGSSVASPSIQCDLPTAPPPPPDQLGCGALRLLYAAGPPRHASVEVSPWEAGARLSLRWAAPARAPRVEQGSVRNADAVQEAHDSPQAAASLTFRLGDGPATGPGRVEFDVLDDTVEPPHSLSCEAQRLSARARLVMSAEVEYRACLEVRLNSTNTRDLRPAQWCHDLPRTSCEAHYYELPDTDVLVRCMRVSGGCDAASTLLSCVPPRNRPSPPPSPPRPPPAWIELAQGRCAYLLRPPHVEALSSASFAVLPQREGAEGAAERCESAATPPTVEVRRGAQGDDVPWQALPARMVDGAVVVDDVRCGDVADARCAFRLKPAGWGESSRATPAISGLALPAAPTNAARLELALLTGRSLCMSCSGARAGLVADLAAVLQLPPSNVRLVEVREAGTSASVVFDVLPHNERDADALAQQLAALVPLAASDLYGGDVSQYVDASAGLVRLHAGLARPVAKTNAASGAPPSPSMAPVGSDDGLASLARLWASVAAAFVAAAGGSATVIAVLVAASCLFSGRRRLRSKHQRLPATGEEDEADEAEFGLSAGRSSFGGNEDSDDAGESEIGFTNMRLARPDASDDESDVQPAASLPPPHVVQSGASGPPAVDSEFVAAGEIERF